MKRLLLAASVFMLCVSAPLFADETGTGKPNENGSSNTTQSTASSDSCSMLDKLKGNCDEQ